MRHTVLLQDGWRFAKTAEIPAAFPESWQPVTLPHTWNAADGTDGGNDYWRGTACYCRRLTPPALAAGEQLWLEFEGAAMTAEVYLNGRKLARHAGGYSTFRVELPPALVEGVNLLAVLVDNSENDTVYPQKADFTFYGGLYRPVRLITVPAAHFALDYYGGPGLKVTPAVDLEARTAAVTVEAWITGEAASVTFSTAGQTFTVPVENGHASAVFTLENVHLWDGIEDPYLYTVTASLDSGDSISVRYGCRTIGFDADKGFLLNGRVYRLCGAARHQDRQGLGSALTNAEHEEDMALLREMGANTVRLAHYQHAQHFYDLCDEYGLIVWAEIPYITKHMENGRANTVSQMTELVVQNYNHPSIVCWGLSNEITASGGVTPDMVENHKLLNDLCHKLDVTRPTTMAHAFMLDMDDPFVMASDIRSYNLYYGWYLGELEQNDEWFDEFHQKHPEAVIGLSEYGADANPVYQNGHPEKGDWSEPYQAIYHEHMLKMWSERPYIWAMHCWNMFDFAADGRNEGGKPGQNQKGLVTFDRKTKKDAFYIYKAYLSKEPFVHICGRRYADRPEAVTEVKVYSNQPAVTLLVDSREFATQTGDKIFKFQVPITGAHTIEARSGELSDTIAIRKVDKPNPAYSVTGGEVVNWFDRPDELERAGYYSILDSMEAIKQSPAGAALLARMMAKVTASYGDVAKSVTLPAAVQRQMDKMPLQNLLKQAGKAVTPEMAQRLNNALNQIPRVS
ncbi:glycoside hydrolase family 2 TIM barrel-domain containing protein [uncultured Subdoligranulum sp.]|uniref:glycoside hydrolase family 2 protein n=1 Tax=uncultured Subdoligranulum sp. TaxID=512298 RepID=UPI0025F26C1A|nr:glycoside hydrolase family 2 TIM barrel-domain containing protein [uncultured Subdoligranulum sp.]